MDDSNKFDDNFNKVWAILTEVATRQEQNELQMAELRKQTAETDRRLNELRVQTAETDKRLNKLMIGNESIQSFIKNDADACEQRFVESLDSNDLIVAGVKFYEIHSNVRKKLGGKNIELDALLINGDSIAIMEVKKKLHLNDVVKVRDNLIGRFRHLFPEHQAKRLLVLVAGESINADAKDQALEAGFVVLSFKARELQMQTRRARYC